MVDQLKLKGGYAEGELTKAYQTVHQAHYTVILDEKEIIFQHKDNSFAISYSDIDSYFIRKGMIITKLKSGKVFTFWLRRRGKKRTVSTKHAKEFVNALDKLIA